MKQTTVKAAERPCYTFDPAYEGVSNEALYAALCAATTPLEAGLKELHYRMKPIILKASKGFLNAFSWTFDDAMGEALILLWELVVKQSFKDIGKRFHCFFISAWRNRLNTLFAKIVVREPIYLGDCKIGMKNDKPILVCGYGFHEKAKEYREKKSAWAKAQYDRKLAAEGKTRQEKKPPLTAEEKRERARIRAAERFAALTPEEKRAKYDRENAARRARRAAMTPEEKAALNERYNGYAKARKARATAE
jgi:hypothetical protein